MNYDKDKIKGDIKEDIFVEFTKKFNDYSIIDVRKNNEYKKIDVDFILLNKKNHSYSKVEVKSLGKGDNIFVELFDNIKDKNKGWYSKTQADILVFVGNDKIVLIQLKDIQNYIKMYVPELDTLTDGDIQKLYERLKLFDSYLHPVIVEDVSAWGKKQWGLCLKIAIKELKDYGCSVKVFWI
jgi:hypothetical protein